jgi:hypothetical protein
MALLEDLPCQLAIRQSSEIVRGWPHQLVLDNYAVTLIAVCLILPGVDIFILLVVCYPYPMGITRVYQIYWLAVLFVVMIIDVTVIISC